MGAHRQQFGQAKAALNSTFHRNSHGDWCAPVAASGCEVHHVISLNRRSAGLCAISLTHISHAALERWCSCLWPQLQLQPSFWLLYFVKWV